MKRVLAIAICAAAALWVPAGAHAAFDDPLFFYTPQSGDLNPVPPAGYLDGPCGLAVSSSGQIYASDYYHRAVDAFTPSNDPQKPNPKYVSQILTAWSGAANPHTGPVDDPCGLALDSAGNLYLNDYHREVVRFPAPVSLAGAEVIDTGDPTDASANPTGVAVAPATDHAYVDDRTYVAEYDAAGSFVQTQIGEGSLDDGYGITVSGYGASSGYLYVPDAASDTVKVLTPPSAPCSPRRRSPVPPGGFGSLRDSAIAVDDATGEIYVADTLGPQLSEEPQAIVYVFSAAGAYEGRLKHNTIAAAPIGLAVDNSGGTGVEDEGEQGRVYVTSGNTERSSVIAYGPDSAGSQVAAAPQETEAPPPGGCACGVLPEPPLPVTCEGDSCQHLPSEPTDPALNTLIEGAANPPVRFHDTNRLSHYLRLRHHRGGQHRAKRNAGGSRYVYRGKTSQKQKIQLSSGPGQIIPIRFKVKLICRDGSLLHADLSDFQASPLERSGRFSDVQRGPTDAVSWRGRLRDHKVSGSMRVKDRLPSGVRCDSGRVRFSAGG